MAKNRLNEGVRTFNKGKYEEAQKIFEEALELDPDNVNAKLFYAMSVNALFEKALNSPSVDKSGTVDAGYKTIKAFQAVLDANPEKFQLRDQATAFIAKTHKSLRDIVYDPVKDEAKYNEERKLYLDFIKKRAEMEGQTEKVKAQMYYTYADDYWKEGHNLVEGFAKKDPANPGIPATYSTVPPDKREKIMAALNTSHEYMQKAIQTDPTYPEPYLGEKLLVMEEINITEDTAKRDALNKEKLKYDELYREKASALAQEQADADAAAAESGAGQ